MRRRSLPPGLRRYIGYFRTSRGRVIAGIALGLIRALSVLPIPLLVGRAIDTAIPDGDSELLVRYGLAIAGLTLFGAALSIVLMALMLGALIIRQRTGAREA